jgi:hypothetical protein
VLRLNSYKKKDGTQIIAGGLATKFMGVYAGRIHEDSEIGRVWRLFVLSEIFESKLLFDEHTGRLRPSRVSACPCGKGKRFS